MEEEPLEFRLLQPSRPRSRPNSSLVAQVSSDSLHWHYCSPTFSHLGCEYSSLLQSASRECPAGFVAAAAAAAGGGRGERPNRQKVLVSILAILLPLHRFAALPAAVLELEERPSLHPRSRQKYPNPHSAPSAARTSGTCTSLVRGLEHG